MSKAISLWVCLALCAFGCGAAQNPVQPDDPQLVVLQGELGNAFVAAGQDADIVSRVRIETRELRNAPRPPINVALVVDTSGSMQGDPIRHARAAALALLEMMGPQDRLAVVVFHSRTDVLLPSTHLAGANVRELRRRISRMEAQGTTDLAGGMRAGLEELVRNYQPDGINRLVLLSDGVPNDPTPILPLAQAAGERRIQITSLGLGLDYDETLLGRIAQLSGGRFHWVENSANVAGTFRNEVLRFERLVARELVLELRPGPGVRIDGVIGRTVEAAGPAVRVSLGDISEDEHVDVMVRLHANARRAGATVELMDAVLSFKDAVVEAGPLERRVFLGARATDSTEQIEHGRNRQIERDAARMMAAVVTMEAIQRAREGDVAQARQILDAAAAQAATQATTAAGTTDPIVEQEVAQMRVLGGALPAITAPEAAPPPQTSEARVETAHPPPAAVIRRAHSRAMEAMQPASN